MRSRIDNDGILIVTPTRDDIFNLKMGDLAINCFGTLAHVTEIYAMGVNVKGKAFVCYYTEFGPTSTISHSLQEDETAATVPLTAKYQRSQSVSAIEWKSESMDPLIKSYWEN